MNPRTIAARILLQVCDQGRSLSGALNELPPSHSDRALIQEICYGTLRNYYSLSSIQTALLSKPIKDKDGDVRMLILVGLYQLIELRIPEHAAVSETVAATKDLGKPWAKGLLNGVLRNFLRDKAGLQERAIAAKDSTRWEHPRWLISALREAWPDHWQQILEANNQRPPMTLRVNQHIISTAEYLAALDAAGIPGKALTIREGAITLERPVDVGKLPGFDAGWASVQDAAAQLAADLLELVPGQRVLDICAAPGGKTGHILEKATVEMVAIDVDPQRLKRVTENLGRLGVSASVLAADATDPDSWWDGVLFDRILLDAPCSATGVIRRHPDIKLLRRPEDISQLADLQQKILARTWPMLKPGGILLYATCSVLPEENEQQIRRFRDSVPDAKLRPICIESGQSLSCGVQLLPGEDAVNREAGSTDGFYYACMEKC